MDNAATITLAIALYESHVRGMTAINPSVKLLSWQGLDTGTKRHWVKVAVHETNLQKSFISDLSPPPAKFSG